MKHGLVAGFDHPGLIKAAQDQYGRFPGYHAFFGRMSDQTMMLSEKRVAVLPFERAKVFYTNAGSEANDTMVKMMWFLSRAEGKPDRRKILTRENGYHGVTVVSASMTGKPYNSVFGLPLGVHSPVLSARLAQPKGGRERGAIHRPHGAGTGRHHSARRPRHNRWFLCRPVMGAGGVIPPSAGYFQVIQPIMKKIRHSLDR